MCGSCSTDVPFRCVRRARTASSDMCVAGIRVHHNTQFSQSSGGSLAQHKYESRRMFQWYPPSYAIVPGIPQRSRYGHRNTHRVVVRARRIRPIGKRVADTMSNPPPGLIDIWTPDTYADDKTHYRGYKAVHTMCTYAVRNGGIPRSAHSRTP